MRFSRLLLVSAILCAALLGLPSVAHARVSEYQVQFSPIGDTNTMQVIVNVVLSPETPLPATVQVPLPTGATILWAGEILGGDPNADPVRETSVTAGAGGQIVSFTLQEQRVAQVEAQLPAAQVSGSTVTAPLSWVNTTEEGTYTFSVAFEAGASDIKITPPAAGQPLTNELGESLHTLTPVRLAQGQSFDLSVVYKRGGTKPVSSGGGANVPLIVAIVALVAAVIALVVVLTRQRSGVTGPPAQPVKRAETTATTGSADDEDFFTFE
ncbi:MAG: hypothetical protein ACYC77_06435 [Coriobacteriia bacterium]